MTGIMHFNTNLSFIEQLPAEIIGNVLCQLNRVTGSVGIINQADVPVVMRFAQNLSSTCKTMMLRASDATATNLFLRSLAEKYGKRPEEFAAQFNTRASLKWLWQYIQTNKLDVAYQTIQDIYDFASSVLRETKEAGLEFDYYESRKAHPTPYPIFNQTCSGFFLSIKLAPLSIATPFGEIQIFSGSSCSGSPLSVSELFIRRLKCTYEKQGSLQERFGIFGRIATPSDASDKVREILLEDLKEISHQDVDQSLGTQDLVIHNWEPSYYKIGEVGGKVLPDAAWHTSNEEKRSFTLIDRMWQMLEFNRLGKDPLSVQIVPKSKIVETLPRFTNSTEIALFTKQLLGQLDRQPIHYRYKFLANTRSGYKFLAYDGQEINAVIRLHSAASQFLEKDNHYYIHYSIGSGIEHSGLEHVVNENLCSVEAQSNAYDLAVKSLGMNWVASNLRDYPDICCTQSEEDYVLFIKKEKNLEQEAQLIQALARDLGIDQFISCNSYWEKTAPKELVDTPYLWIKKDKLDQVTKALQLTLSNDRACEPHLDALDPTTLSHTQSAVRGV